MDASVCPESKLLANLVTVGRALRRRRNLGAWRQVGWVAARAADSAMLARAVQRAPNPMKAARLAWTAIGLFAAHAARGDEQPPNAFELHLKFWAGLRYYRTEQAHIDDFFIIETMAF